jgi:hypothetical protein
MAIVINGTKSTFRAGAPEFGIPSEAVDPVFSAVGAAGVVSWADNGAGGAFTTLSSTSASYRPPNETQVVTITGNDGGGNGSGFRTLDVSATFPLTGNWNSEGELDRETTEQRARGGTQYFREEEKDTFSQQIDCLGRGVATEGAALLAFWRFHRKVLPFYFLDVDTGELQKVRFTSAVRWRKTGGDIKDYFVNVKGFDNEQILDFEPPDVLLITPAANAEVSGTILLSASATDNVEVASVQFTIDGVLVGAPILVPPYQYNFDTTSVGNGNRIVSARAFDGVGNRSDAPARIVTVNN